MLAPLASLSRAGGGMQVFLEIVRDGHMTAQQPLQARDILSAVI